jgi:hypothetical protein
VATAAPPSNDDLDTATVVTALPFTTTVDTREATKAPDDPYWCQTYDIGGTVWFDYAPAEDVLLRATASDPEQSVILSAQTGDRDDLSAVPDACDIGSTTPAKLTFAAEAGTTYHFMVAGYDVPGGDLSFGLDVVSPAPNDAFADATPITALPATLTADLSVASTEYDEPESGPPCFGQADRSVWYSFTAAESTSLIAGVDPYDTDLAVYAGGSLAGLRQIDCANGGYSDDALFGVTAGTTYYLRVTGSARVDQATLTVSEAPPLHPYFDTYPYDPTSYELTQFNLDSGEFGTPIVSGELDFGDGTVAPLDGSGVSHHYTADGTYRVRMSIATEDGRTGTFTGDVTVATHDVSVARLAVPAKARTGETKTITVHVAGAGYREPAVTATLYRSDGSYWQQVGSLTLDVPKDTTVKFPFAYTFTAADAVTGKVAFWTVVRLRDGVRDARPFDNELISTATAVTPSPTALRFA